MKSILQTFFLATIFILAELSFAQENENSKPQLYEQIEYSEHPDDEYIPVRRDKQLRSPSYRVSGTGYFTSQVNVDQFQQNILGDAANESSITVDPNNQNNMAIGWRQFDTISSNFRQAGYAYSTDAGQTWAFPDPIEAGIFRSDPVLGANNNSKFFYYSLSTAVNYTCEIFNSTNGGAFWSGPVEAYGGDKGWMIVDRTNSIGHGNIYCFSRDDIATTIVMTRSVNGGQFFQPLVNVPLNPGRGTMAVGVDGELYAAGLSFNNGEFVLARSTNAPDSSVTPVFEYSTELNLGGEAVLYAGPNPGGLLGQVIVACDNHGASGDSSVYVLCSVDPPGSDPLDVYFIRSTDRGETWSSPMRINDDAGNSAWQWFGTMSVAPNGRIDVVWLDTRDNPGTYLSSLYYSYSEDYGITWSQNEQLSDAFDPYLGWPNQNKMGDYFDMVSDNEGASLAWCGTLNSEEDVYYTRIYLEPVAVEEEQDIPGTFSLSQNYPNPFNPTTKIKYSIPSSDNPLTGGERGGLVTLKVYDALGNEITTLVNEEKSAGTYEVEFNAGETRRIALTSGIYFYKLQVYAPGRAGSFVETKKMILLK